MIDTNVAIHLRDDSGAILDKIDALDARVVMSVITWVELEGGLTGPASRVSARRLRLAALYATIPSLSFDEEAASIYGEIVGAIGYSRRKLLDRMIGAHALQQRATLITLNPQDFSDIPGLSILAW